MSINRVTITGNLSRDVELRMTTNGTPVANFVVVVDDRKQNTESGMWEKRSNLIPCVIFGNRAEKIAKVCAKGTKVAIEGKLRQNSWEKDGERRNRIEVAVDDLDFVPWPSKAALNKGAAEG